MIVHIKNIYYKCFNWYSLEQFQFPYIYTTYVYLNPVSTLYVFELRMEKRNTLFKLRTARVMNNTQNLKKSVF
jgi:hypothetical protein